MTNSIEFPLVNSYNEIVRNVRRVRNMKDINYLDCIATVTSKGQITIPKEIRKQLKLKEGSKVAFYYDGDYFIFGEAHSLMNKELNDTAKMMGFENNQDLCNWIKNEIRPEIIKRYKKEKNIK